MGTEQPWSCASVWRSLGGTHPGASPGSAGREEEEEEAEEEEGRAPSGSSFLRKPCLGARCPPPALPRLSPPHAPPQPPERSRFPGGSPVQQLPRIAAGRALSAPGGGERRDSEEGGGENRTEPPPPPRSAERRRRPVPGQEPRGAPIPPRRRDGAERRGRGAAPYRRAPLFSPPTTREEQPRRRAPTALLSCGAAEPRPEC
ncbi:proline-rich protein 2-like [Gallus gallus]|uniref:proline-rich protein 2-like n=1 Tax=Gallus gallus TaxID=9031 RepID=UPI001F010688|nr:proline-rich protein 2-like [Gallus gallus]